MQQRHFTAFYFLLILRTWSVRGQSDGCLSLEGSKACPAYSRYYLPLVELDGRYPFLAHVTDLDSFDRMLFDYAQSNNFYMDRFGCHSTQRVPYARYSLTRLCAMVVHDVAYTSPHCNADHAVAPVPPLCERTCEAWMDSILSNIRYRCFNSDPNYGSVMDYSFMEQCLDRSSVDNCISGEQNEPDHCGFQGNTASACQYCRYNQTDACCNDMACGALSGGDIAGIVVGCVVGAAMIALALFCLCSMRRRVLSRRKSSNNQFQFKTYEAAPLDEDEYDKHDSNIPLTHNLGGNDTTQDTHHTNTTPAASKEPMMNDASEIPPTTAATTMTPPLSPPQQPRPEDLYFVVYPYPPQMGDELALHAGDLICLAVSFDDGWAIGYNVMTGLKGAFPMVCVTPAPPDLIMDEPPPPSSSQSLSIKNDDDDDDDDDESNKPCHHHHDDDPITSKPTKMVTQPNQLKLLNVDRIREKVRRSMSLGNLPPTFATMTQHRHIPRRTASMRNTNLYNPAEADDNSPTSPNTPFFDMNAAADEDIVPLSKAVVRSPPPQQLHKDNIVSL